MMSIEDDTNDEENDDENEVESTVHKKVKIYLENDEERILALTQAHNNNIKICSRF